MQQAENAADEQAEKKEAKRDADGKGDAGAGGAERGEKGGNHKEAAAGSRQTDTAVNGTQ